MKYFKGYYARVCGTKNPFFMNIEDFREEAQKKFPSAGRAYAVKEYARSCGLLLQDGRRFVLNGNELYDCEIETYRGVISFRFSAHGEPFFVLTEAWSSGEGELQGGELVENERVAPTLERLLY